MRISLLLEREPFGRILEETLPPLLSALSGRPHAVRWQGHGRVDGARGGQACGNGAFAVGRTSGGRKDSR